MSLQKKIHLREDERVVQTIHAYPLTNLWKYAVGLVFLGASAFFAFWLTAQELWGYIALAFGLTLGVYVILKTWFFNHHNFLVITSERVVDIHRASWFEENVSSISYVDIKDVVIRRRGVPANIFNYGSVIVETKDKFYFLEAHRVREPHKVQNTILELESEFKSSLNLKNNEAVFAEFLKIIPFIGEGDLLIADKKIHDQLDYLDHRSADKTEDVV